jgi:hypothetical protein
MQTKIKRLLTAGAILSTVTALSGCAWEDDADVASRNISKDADNFKVPRRIVAINGITDKPLLAIQGLCNINDSDGRKLVVVCKVKGGYKKDFVGISDNTTYVVQQMDAKNVSVSRYKVVLKPSTLLPDVEIR